MIICFFVLRTFLYVVFFFFLICEWRNVRPHAQRTEGGKRVRVENEQVVPVTRSLIFQAPLGILCYSSYEFPCRGMLFICIHVFFFLSLALRKTPSVVFVVRDRIEFDGTRALIAPVV